MGQLALTYGDGKARMLVTLYNLTHDPAHLPRGLLTRAEFEQHIAASPARNSPVWVEPPMPPAEACHPSMIDYG